MLIFDNCETEAILDDWAPKGGGCRLLITARRLSWSPGRGINAVPLGTLARAESLALLHHHRPDLRADDPGLDAIADELGDLPLALELAGRYLARYQFEPSGAPATYLAELRDAADILAHVSLTVEDPQAEERLRLLTGHELGVACTFEVSLRRLRPDHPTDAFAREVLARVAWLAAGEPIPLHLLKVCAGVATNDAVAARRLVDAVERLLNLALLERSNGNGSVVLHRLLAAFARSRLDGAKTARGAVEATVADEANRLVEGSDPTPFRIWAKHLLAVASAAGRDRTVMSADLLNAAGYYNHLEANYEASESMLRDAAERAQATFGPRHPKVVGTLNNLSMTQRARGDLAAAEATMKQALVICQNANALLSHDFARVLTNFGNVQRLLGKLRAAEASQTLALLIHKTLLRADHPGLAIILTNLGAVQAERRAFAAALACLSRALAIKEKELRLDHPTVVVTLINLGNLQLQLGLVGDARKSYMRAVAISVAELGEQHPRTVLARRALANLMAKYGKGWEKDG